MKFAKRSCAFLLVCSLLIGFLVACEPKEKKIYDEVYAYLNECYKGVEFEINSYTQDIETSGKYVFDVTCLTTGLHFTVIKSSLYISDSYYVVHANNRLQEELFELLGSATELVNLESVQCFDRYEEDSVSYRFNEDAESVAVDLDELESIFRVNMSEMESSNEAAQCVYMFCDILENKGISLERVNFEFTLNGERIRLETNTNAIDSMHSFEALERLFEQTKTSTASNIFYKELDSDIKVIPFPNSYN